MGRDWFVQVSQRWVSRPAPGHWTPAVFLTACDDVGPVESVVSVSTVAVYRIENVRKTEAIDVVFSWLAQDRPQAMTVRQVWPR